jgi:sodium-dependent dicarboxylate transporter 2/3/5
MRTSLVTTSFDRWRKPAGIVVAPLVAWLTYVATHDKLSPEGRPLSAIMSAVGVLWVTEAIPLPITAVLGAVLCVVCGVADATAVFAHFADPIVFLFLGSFMLARAMAVHQLDRRFALAFLSIRWISAHPARIIAGLGLVTAGLSMWISNTATTAMMLPIALGILGAIEGASRPAAGEDGVSRCSQPLAVGLLLMVAYSASIGGIGTPVGSPPNLIAIGLIRGTLAVNITFLQWMLLTVPLLIVMGAVLFGLLYLFHPIRPLATAGDSALIVDYIARERAALGGWTRGQANTLFAFAFAVILWTVPGVLALFMRSDDARLAWISARLPESVAALLAAILLFILPTDLRRGQFTLAWSDAVRIDWGTILLFGGGLCLGSLMFTTGVAEALAKGVVGATGASSLWGLTAAAIALGILLSESTSNTAAANMIVPVVIAVAQSAGVNPLPPALGATLGASYGFMLPVSTPPNAIVYSSGRVPITSMIRAGAVFDLAGFAIIFAGLRILCPLFGWQ